MSRALRDYPSVLLYAFVLFPFPTTGSTAAAINDGLSRQVSLNIPADVPLEEALLQFSRETGVQMLFASSSVERKATSAELRGTLDARAALSALLEHSGLKFAFAKNTVAIVPEEQRVSDIQPAHRSGLHETSSSEPAAARNQVPEQPTTVSGGRRSSGIPEVIVTASKREEAAQDLPLSIAVIGNLEIERRGLIGMEDYLRAIPGVNQIDTGARSNAIVIRGITTSPEAENANSGTTVASYFDETPITGAAGLAAGGIDVRPVDIERTEILRGPQGTAYGSASLGGTFRMIPAKPQLDRFVGKLAAGYSDTANQGGGNSMFQGVINIPVVDGTFALRAVGYRYDDSGFYRNIVGVDPATVARATALGIENEVQGYVQDDVGRMRSTGGRLAALWEPTDRLRVSANYLTQEIEQDGRPLASVGLYEQIRFPIASQSQLRGEKGEIGDARMDLGGVVVNYDLSWADVTSAASWVHGRSTSALDLLSGGFAVPASSIAPADFESFTGEARLTSKFGGPVQFLAGLFYEDVDEEASQTIVSPGPPAPNTFGTNPIGVSEIERQREQRAAFGELSYDITKQLTATVGARYFEYDKGDRSLAEGGVFRVPFGTGTTQSLRKTDSDSTFKANLSYKPTEDALLYATWGQGFRLGRATPGLPPATCDANSDGLLDGTGVSIESTRTIDSDFLDNYELGAKLAFLDRRVILDASVHHIDWTGLPISVRAAACNTTYIANAGAATSRGAELEVSFLVVEGLRADVGAGYTRAELAKDAPALGASEGARLPGSPRFSANLALQYEFTIAGHAAFIRTDSFYTGRFYGDLLQSPLTEAGGYTKVDMRTGVKLRNVTVDFFVRNLTNAEVYTWRGLRNASADFGYRLRPRTIGIQLGYTIE